MEKIMLDLHNNRVQSSDRIIVLEPIPGQKPKTSSGLDDPRLFSGENKLHAVMEPNCLWYLKYEMGGLPEPLKQKFTSFPRALAHVKQYFLKRGVQVKEVID